ncbi:leucine-rich repeat-containing protein 17-like [Melanotaenia boesemani]|uniref:leucine-rich repeat-containing protein 17-like n=1 Tax=Melanotaenia boesemani TaxID=1250792 RepID=UPI001C04738D|nr:leucine-rich repeat-containing protein 17-like [Melanotaenia boesemani]XP_041852580.1 leucine-rich repeat-containing protein 17-like [Melanotaenia boesemani]XP_041852581.1 leucine-rich repeat-containing protein 17-like [Melanotaenia boesemani]XP_041852582.1 leucine-rich repeat-containing protein 17-like [Melanotaenia boesemani]
MHVIHCLLIASLLLLLLPSVEMKRPGKGRGLKRARHKLTREKVRVRGGKRHSRSGPAGFVSHMCSESKESGKVFVDCQDQGLTFIPPSKAWSRAPKHLLLARNQIKVLNDGAFLGYKSLKSLDLQQNLISNVEEGAFEGLTRLTTLLLQHNRLGTLSEEVLIPMSNLHYLRLHDNPWNCLCPMESLIRTLQVPSNRNLGNHARCAEPIRLKNRRLKNVDPELLCKEPNSTSDLNSDLEDLMGPAEPSPIRSKPDAIALCHIYIIPEILMDCSNRGLTEVPSGIPEDVVQIDLSHNSIHHLKPRDFQGAKSLKVLNLSNNNMEHIDTGSLSGLLHLNELDLSHNNLHFVQYGVLEDLYFLSQLKLKANPWVCDYSIHYIVYWLRLHPRVRHSGLLCHSPLEYTGQSVEEYVHSYNRDCSDRQHSITVPDQTDSELWDTLMEVQGEVEEELEPSHLRALQKYQIIRLA